MARYLNLQVPSSCQEKWDEMLPGKNGRYCLSCQKTVLDFTGMTDADLVRYFKDFKGAACGKFTESQLNRDLLIPKKSFPWLKYFFRITLPAFLLSLKSSVQGQKIKPQIEIAPVKLTSVPKIIHTKGSAVTGNVTDEKGTPLPAASVVIKGTNRGVLSDEEGKFMITDVALPVSLVVSYIGYNPQEVKVDSIQQGIQMKLTMEPVNMGEVTVGIIITTTVRKKKSSEFKKPMHVNAFSSMRVYPNPLPSGSTLNIECRNLKSGTYKADLYSLAGQLVQCTSVDYEKESRINLHIGQLLPGNYLLHLRHEKSGKFFSQQVIVK